MTRTKVFVSYVRSDHALAEQLFRTLHSMPVEVWSDDQLKAGENWSDVLRSRIRDSEFFLLLLAQEQELLLVLASLLLAVQAVAYLAHPEQLYM